MKQKQMYLVVVFLVAGVTYFLNGQSDRDQGQNSVKHYPGPVTEQLPQATYRDQSELLKKAFEQRQSSVWATVNAGVKRTLSDDNEGSRHQRFLIQLDNGQSILVAHNIDLAPRVPVKSGSAIWLRGRYEWSDKGGVLHWTHRDPQAGNQQILEEGWIEVAGRRYE